MITDWTEEILELRYRVAELEARIRELESSEDEPESTEGYSLAECGKGGTLEC